MTHVHGDTIKEDLIMKDNFTINNETKDESTKAEEKKTTGDVTPETPTQEEEHKTAGDTTPRDPEPEIVVGIVSNCPRLRVRKTPSPNAPVLTEIVNGSEVVIDESKSTGYFYAVVTESGVEGFCMKEYIQVR